MHESTTSRTSCKYYLCQVRRRGIYLTPDVPFRLRKTSVEFHPVVLNFRSAATSWYIYRSLSLDSLVHLDCWEYTHLSKPPCVSTPNGFYRHCAAKEWYQAQEPTKSEHLRTTLISSPSSETLPSTTCISDATWRQDSKSTDLGWIFCDSSTMEIGRGQQIQLHVLSPLMAEGLAFWSAMIHAWSSVSPMSGLD